MLSNDEVRKFFKRFQIYLNLSFFVAESGRFPAPIKQLVEMNSNRELKCGNFQL